MRKFASLVCATVMTLSMACTAFANPSISSTGIEEQTATVDAATAAKIPAGMSLVVNEAKPENYSNKDVAEAVTKLNDASSTISVKEILEILKVDLTKEMKTTSGAVIDPTEYEPITKFSDLALSDGAELKYDVDGNVLEVKATIKVEALKDIKDIKNVVLMQIDPTSGEVYLIEIDEDDYDAETGEITVTFPCLGPFTVLEKAE